MIVRFYNDPLLDREHHIVRKGGQPLGFLYQEEIREIVDPWAGELVIEVKRRPFSADTANTAPNMATIGNSVYFVNVEAVTPTTVRMRLLLDWWGTYASDLKVSATIRRTPDQNNGYGIEARFMPKTSDVTSVPLGLTQFGPNDPASRRYVLVMTFTCYVNNAWPAADGEPFQVTFISKNVFTPWDLLHSAVARNTLAPEKFYLTSGGAEYTVVSVVRCQIVPYDLLFGWGEDQVHYIFDRTQTSTLWAQLGQTTGGVFTGSDGVAVLMNGYYYGPAQPEYQGEYYIFPYSSAAWNTSGYRLFLGNRHNRVALPDVNYNGTDAEGPLGRIVVTLAAGVGIVAELEAGDSVIDISGFFDATTTYSSEKEAAYMAGDSRAISAVAAGVGSAVQIATGTARMAAGDVTGITGIIAGGIGAVGAVENARIRGREIVTAGNHTALADSQSGILSLLRVKVQNDGERAADAFWRGYLSISSPTVFNRTLSYLLDPPVLAEGVAAGAFALSDIHLAPVVKGEFGADLGNLLPVPDAETIATASAELERGILVISPTMTDLEAAWLLFPR